VPWQPVTKPTIEVPLCDDGDVVLRVTGIGTEAASHIIETYFANPSGSFVAVSKVALHECQWEVAGAILDDDGREIQDANRRTNHARRGVLLNADLCARLCLEMLRWLKAIPGNSPQASSADHEGSASPPAPGTVSEDQPTE
jgi:hypothetical protein